VGEVDGNGGLPFQDEPPLSLRRSAVVAWTSAGHCCEGKGDPVSARLADSVDLGRRRRALQELASRRDAHSRGA